jgi:hypothetical protein
LTIKTGFSFRFWLFVGQRTSEGGVPEIPAFLVPKLLLGNPIFRQSSCFAINPKKLEGDLPLAKPELGAQVRSQAGSWERGESLNVEQAPSPAKKTAGRGCSTFFLP